MGVEEDLFKEREENYRLRSCLEQLGISARTNTLAAIESATTEFHATYLSVQRDYAALLLKLDQVTQQMFDPSRFDRNEGEYFHARRQGCNDAVRTLRAACGLPALKEPPP